MIRAAVPRPAASELPVKVTSSLSTGIHSMFLGAALSRVSWHCLAQRSTMMNTQLRRLLPGCQAARLYRTLQLYAMHVYMPRARNCTAAELDMASRSSQGGVHDIGPQHCEPSSGVWGADSLCHRQQVAGVRVWGPGARGGHWQPVKGQLPHPVDLYQRCTSLGFVTCLQT